MIGSLKECVQYIWSRWQMNDEGSYDIYRGIDGLRYQTARTKDREEVDLFGMTHTPDVVLSMSWWELVEVGLAIARLAVRGGNDGTI